MESTVSILQSLTLLSGPVCRHKSCSLSPLPFQGPIVVININADNLELEENDDGSKIVNIKAGNDDQQILEEEEFIPDYEDYEDYDEDDDIGVVSLRWVSKDMVALFCSTSPEEILTLMNMMGGRTDVSGTRREQPIFTTCPAATVCVALSR